MCKHVSVLQIAQQDPKVQKRKKKNLVNNVRKITAERESWHYFFNRHLFGNLICEFQKFKPCCCITASHVYDLSFRITPLNGL